MCSGDAVRCFSTATGLPVGSPLSGHAADVTAVGFHPGHPGGQVVLTASLDGTVRLWNAQDGSPGAVLTAPGPVESMVIPGGRSAHGRDVIFLSCWQRVNASNTNAKAANSADAPSNETAAGAGGRVHAFSLGKGKSVDKLLKTQSPPRLTCSPNGTFLGTWDKHTVIVWPLTLRETGVSLATKTLRLHHTKPITTMAFDVNDKAVAAGDSTGRILTWHGFAQAVEFGKDLAVNDASKTAENSEIPCTTYHWHAQAVGCLLFSTDGSYLLSGGKESVLVLWQLESGKKSYLPRLGGELIHMARFPGDASKIATAHGDNAVRFISLSSLTVECVARGIRPGVLHARYPSYARDTSDAILSGRITHTQPAPAVSYDPVSKTLALAATGASLQLFCPIRDAHVCDLAVAPRNQVSGDGGVDDPMTPYVSHACFSSDGSFLVTVDRRSERAMPGVGDCTADASNSLANAPEETLRIWTRNVRRGANDSDDLDKSTAQDLGFTCVCVCDAPHVGFVTSVSVRGSLRDGDAMACTTSVSGDAKMWVPGDTGRAGERAGWRCRSAVSHSGYPAPALTAGAFSQDGSLLATGGDTVTVWEPDSCAMLHSFSLPKFQPAGSDHHGKDHDRDGKVSSKSNLVSGLAFIAQTPLLAAVSPEALVVWNLATLGVWRVVKMPCLSIASHPQLARFAVTARAPENKGYLVFRFAGDDAHAVGCSLAPGGAGPPQGLVYPPGSKEGLFVVTRDRRVAAAEDARGAAAEAGGVRNELPLSTSQLGDEKALSTTHQAGGVSMSGAGLKPINNLETHAKALQGNPAGLQSAIGANAKPGGNNPWGSLFDAPSHELAPLTTLAPHFLDALLERQAI